ncbi:MAG: sulfatase-like hydrolase/transferase [Rhizobiaceae bacterium]|nr:sulfatase-like hydrolase/transferase [Rhizobiaceae bacterium]
MKKSPNFLFFITDQQRADWLGCAGHKVVKTPNIDSIAEQGVRLSNFNVAMPVCMPNRASLLTGRYPSVHGLRYNGCVFPRRANTFVDVLRAGGYATAAIGKSHLQPFTSQPPVRPEVFEAGAIKEAWKPDDEDYGLEEPDRFAQDEPAEFGDDYYGYQHVDMVTSHGDQAGGHYQQWFRKNAIRTGKDWSWYHDPSNELKHNYSAEQAYRTPIPEDLYPTSFIRDRAMDYLASRAGSDQPFFTFVSFPDPHHPFNPPGKYWDMYQPDQFDLDIRYTDHITPPPPLKYQYEMFQRGELPQVKQAVHMDTEQAIRESMALTAGMITMVDDAIGSIVEGLKQSGHYENTVICFNSDHGDYLGDSDLLLKGPWQRDSIVKVPFIWSDPATRKHGQSDALASTVDIAPTILNRAGLAPYFGIQGRSLLPVLNDGVSVRDDLLVEHNDSGPRMGFEPTARVRSLLTENWRLTVYKDEDWGELFDIENDPTQVKNLWFSESHENVKSELMERLVAHLIAQMDESPRSNRLA